MPEVSKQRQAGGLVLTPEMIETGVRELNSFTSDNPHSGFIPHSLSRAILISSRTNRHLSPCRAIFPSSGAPSASEGRLMDISLARLGLGFRQIRNDGAYHYLSLLDRRRCQDIRHH
jgi:hypothetical protein